MRQRDPLDTRQDISIERLLWFAYRDPVAVHAGGLTIEERAMFRGPDSVVKVARAARLGTLAPTAAATVTLHPDAELVVEAVGRIKSRDVRQLVVHHATVNSRPDWMEGLETYFAPVLRASGKPVLIYIEKELRDYYPTRVSVHALPGRRRQRPKAGGAVPKGRRPTLEKRTNAFACVIEEINPPSLIRAARSQWAVWRKALSDLRRDLEADRIAKFRLTAELPKKRPWQ